MQKTKAMQKAAHGSGSIKLPPVQRGLGKIGASCVFTEVPLEKTMEFVVVAMARRKSGGDEVLGLILLIILDKIYSKSTHFSVNYFSREIKISGIENSMGNGS